MARNDERRTMLADAGIRVLAEEGARGLTHRAVDAAASLPRGTASNYYSTRDALIAGLVARIGERLTPDPAQVAARAAQGAGRAVFAAHVRDVIRRLTVDPHLSLALFELRLEATRRPAVADILSAWRQAAFEADVAFNKQAGLPGGALEIALFHYALDGLMLDHVTVPLGTGLSIDVAVDEFVERLLPGGK